MNSSGMDVNFIPLDDKKIKTKLNIKCNIRNHFWILTFRDPVSETAKNMSYTNKIKRTLAKAILNALQRLIILAIAKIQCVFWTKYFFPFLHTWLHVFSGGLRLRIVFTCSFIVPTAPLQRPRPIPGFLRSTDITFLLKQ